MCSSAVVFLSLCAAAQHKVLHWRVHQGGYVHRRGLRLGSSIRPEVCMCIFVCLCGFKKHYTHCCFCLCQVDRRRTTACCKLSTLGLHSDVSERAARRALQGTRVLRDVPDAAARGPKAQTRTGSSVAMMASKRSSIVPPTGQLARFGVTPKQVGTLVTNVWPWMPSGTASRQRLLTRRTTRSSPPLLKPCPQTQFGSLFIGRLASRSRCPRRFVAKSDG